MMLMEHIILHTTRPFLTCALPKTPSSAGAKDQQVAAAVQRCTTCPDLAAVLDQVARELAILVGGVCQVRFIPPERATVTHWVVAGLYTPPYDAWATSGDTSSPALVAQLSNPEDDQGTACVATMDAAAASQAVLLFVPLMVNGQCIGTLDLVFLVSADIDMGALECLVWAFSAPVVRMIKLADRRTPLLGATTDAPLALLAHDLRASLTSIRTSVQLLNRFARSAAELSRERIIRVTELADMAIRHLETQIQTLASPEGADPQPTTLRPPVDLVHVTQLLVQCYQQTTGHHTLTFHAQAPELCGAWSELHIERVLGNLLDNAIKYSPAGGAIPITLAREEDEAGCWARLSVQNQGIGIPLSDLSRLGQSGARAENVGAIPGTGLGLASVRMVLEQYGGTLTVQSSVGATTTVSIRLPLGQAAVE